MRIRPFSTSLAAAGAIAIAAAADGGPLLSATWSSSFPGRGLTITSSGSMCPDTDPDSVGDMVVSCSPGGLQAVGNAGSTSYSVSLTVPLFSYAQFTTTGVIPFHTKATLAGDQFITGNENSATGIPGVPGYLTVKAALHTKASTLMTGRTTLVKVPLSVGRKGQFTNYFLVLGVLHYITVDLFAWTPHTLTFSNLTSKDMPGQPGDMATKVVAMGSHNLGSYRPASKVPKSQFFSGTYGGGMVTLVSPSLITIEGCPLGPDGRTFDCGGTGLADRKSASFTTLKLTYFGHRYFVHGTPEPASALLLGAGVAVVLLVGTRRRG